MRHPALLSREFTPMDDGKTKVVEKWDWRHPQCPFLIDPHLRAQLRDEHVIIDVKYLPSEALQWMS